MTSDRPPRLVGLASKLGKFLAQHADDRRLIGSKPQRLGLIEIGRTSQLAE